DNVEEDCGTRAVVAIADLASGTRGVTCSTDPLVSVPALMSPPSGNFLHTLATGSDTRVGGGRTGLQRMVASSRAIADISFSGAYELAAIGSNLDGTPKPGVLGFVRPSSITCATTLAGDLRGQNLPALSEIAGGHPRWTHHLGPQGKQGIPGPPGYKGPQGAPGPPGTCPTTPPPCP
ncbi:MAG: hypothetical protein OYH77_08340, partial [Pseudomonadota bacterium]|nr:hypothetical protein [Pseudomonadota bacterium]